MVCTYKKRPFLRVGKYYLTSYERAWMEEALEKAAWRMGGDIEPFKEELLSSIFYYLEELCASRVLTLEVLSEKVRQMLVFSGLENLAESWELLPPPFVLDLSALARQCPYPLFFFSFLEKELLALREEGIAQCAFLGLRDCILLLESKARWTKSCDLREQELLAFLQKEERAWAYSFVS